MNWNTELQVVKLRMPGEMKYSKSLNLEDIKGFLEIKPCSESYEEYIKPGLLYFTEDLNTLAKELGVDRIYPKGLFIEGIYGGEKKKGEEEYAGLVLKEHYSDSIIFKFKLYNTERTLVVPSELPNKYNVRIYKMIYVGEINPFRINKYLHIILSQRGEESLRQFLQEALKLNERNISEDAYKKIEKLIGELKQPGSIETLDMNKYYVVYRRVRAFTASFLKPATDNFIVKDEAGYIKCKDESTAYYYAAILNYLAFKVVESKRSFIRTQYARPILALYIAGLSWNNINDSVKKKVIELSEILHKKSPSKEYTNQKVALKDIARYYEFKEIIKILDSNTDRRKLEEALSIVSGKGVERSGYRKT